jgi:hypothetical protein
VGEAVRVAEMVEMDERDTETVRVIVALADLVAVRVAKELLEAPLEALALFVLVGVGPMPAD